MNTLCAACRELVGRPPAVAPHAALKTQSGHRLPFGWRESYVCEVCEAAFQRVTVDPGFNESQGQAWSQLR